MVLEHRCAQQRAHVQAAHVAALDHTLAVVVTNAGHILGLVVATVDAEVVVVADTRAEHFLLPIHIATVVVDGNTRFLAQGLEAAGTHHVERLGHAVEAYISVIADVGTSSLSFLRGDDDNTIGGLRAIDGGGCGVAQHIDRLDVVGGHHGDVHTGNAVDDIVGLHGLARAER